MTEATSEAARPKLVANVRSKRSSSGVATRCVSCGSRPRMRRESWRMTPMPGSIVLIPKDLSVREVLMHHLFEFRVPKARGLTADRGRSRYGRVIERGPKRVATDHSARTHDDDA